jgi:hypothetical protein
MRGTAEWRHPYKIQISSQELTVTVADSFIPDQTLSQPVEEKDGRYRLQFSPGTLIAH